jgi:DNA-binding transcriptional ArsR family regulator
MATLDRIFAALSDARRRAILEYLRSGDRKAGDVADRFDISWPAISRHLRILKAAGLVLETRVGRSRYYTLNSAVLVGPANSWVNQFQAPGRGSFSSGVPATTGTSQVGREYTS